jgi:hypothetical protein
MTTDDVNGRKTFEFVNPSDCTFDSFMTTDHFCGRFH